MRGAFRNDELDIPRRFSLFRIFGKENSRSYSPASSKILNFCAMILAVFHEYLFRTKTAIFSTEYLYNKMALLCILIVYCAIILKRIICTITSNNVYK